MNFPLPLLAVADAASQGFHINWQDPYTVMFVLVLLSLAPFFIMMVTSYLKIVVVLGLIRNALGIQSIPPNIVLNGLATIMSVYVMAPVAQQTYELLETHREILHVKDALYEARIPLRDFLYRHTSSRDREFFLRSSKVLWPADRAHEVNDNDFIVLVPAFTVTELSSAFEIGFLTYLPFVVVDLIISNILLAMGMMMISPTVISLPFKLLLFVLVNGWSRLIEGIILTYK